MIRRIKTSSRMSQAVIHGTTVYLSGQIASDRSADTSAQTREILTKIDRLLVEAGTDRNHVLAATIYLADMRAFDEMNAVWEGWLPAGSAPARATIGAPLASSEYHVEIVITAALPCAQADGRRG